MIEVFVVIGFALLGIVWLFPFLLWAVLALYGGYVCALLIFNYSCPVVVGQHIKCYDNNRQIIEGDVIEVYPFSLKIQLRSARVVKVSRSFKYLSVK